MPLWLIGMMGSGKSTVGRRLASRTGKPFVDTDVLVEEAAGRSVVDVFQAEGEEAFRSLESDAIREAAVMADAIVATGGGAVLLESNIRSMKSSGPVVWLRASPATLAARIGNAPGRPLLVDVDLVGRLTMIIEDRSDAYQRAADHTVDTDGSSADEVAVVVEQLWNAS